MHVHQIFNGISGEGRSQGIPMIFLRLFGCNLKCAYCDTPQKSTDRHLLTTEQVLGKILEFPSVLKDILITGGEPLLQVEDIITLCHDLLPRFRLHVETNGSISIAPLVEVDGGAFRDTYTGNIHISLDVKCPSAGIQEFAINNLDLLSSATDEVKFIINNEEDLNFVREFSRDLKGHERYINTPKYIQPVSDLYTQVSRYAEGFDLIQKAKRFVERNAEDNFRLGCQLHKVMPWREG